MPLSEHQEQKIAKLPQYRQDFIAKQLNAFEGWMKGNMFMPCDGICYHCYRDIIKEEIGKGNDGSKSVTGCPFCCRSYCE